MEIKIEKIPNVDLQKYKQQKNIRRRHVSIPTNYESICIGSDQDCDGMHIRGLLLSMARKYMPWMLEEGRFLEFRTPLICIFNKNEITEYFFSFEEFEEYQKTNIIDKKKIRYYKGLGSWDADVLRKLIEKIGIEKFLVPFSFDENAEEIILNWFLDERVDYRKEQLLNNKFNLAVI